MSKIVKKPWGYEEWFELNEHYCFKLIRVNAGGKLSLQYHEKKKETLYLAHGNCTMIIGDKHRKMRSGEYVTIEPGTVHRIIADGIGAVTFLEASTPEVDDIVRVDDAYNRITEEKPNSNQKSFLDKLKWWKK